MHPNLFIHTHLMFEQCQQRQRAAEQQRLVARHRFSHVESEIRANVQKKQPDEMPDCTLSAAVLEDTNT